MRIIESLTETTLPTEAYDSLPCEEQGVRDTDGSLWLCTRHLSHDGPHVATYDVEEDEGPLTIIGLAWTNDEEDDSE